MDVNTYPCRNLEYAILVKGAGDDTDITYIVHRVAFGRNIIFGNEWPSLTPWETWMKFKVSNF